MCARDFNIYSKAFCVDQIISRNVSVTWTSTSGPWNVMQEGPLTRTSCYVAVTTRISLLGEMCIGVLLAAAKIPVKANNRCEKSAPVHGTSSLTPAANSTYFPCMKPDKSNPFISGCFNLLWRLRNDSIMRQSCRKRGMYIICLFH